MTRVVRKVKEASTPRVAFECGDSELTLYRPTDGRVRMWIMTGGPTQKTSREVAQLIAAAAGELDGVIRGDNGAE